MSNRAVTKQYIETFGISRSFSTMSNRTVTKHTTLLKLSSLRFSTMSNRTVTKPRHGPAPDLLALASG